eukprot:5985771-Amphidinium_carterae.1
MATLAVFSSATGIVGSATWMCVRVLDCLMTVASKGCKRRVLPFYQSIGLEKFGLPALAVTWPGTALARKGARRLTSAFNSQVSFRSSKLPCSPAWAIQQRSRAVQVALRAQYVECHPSVAPIHNI